MSGTKSYNTVPLTVRVTINTQVRYVGELTLDVPEHFYQDGVIDAAYLEGEALCEVNGLMEEAGTHAEIESSEVVKP
jgi:hypothetical protein